MSAYVEGKVSVLQGLGVFLNPKMASLRDLSVLFLKTYPLSKDARLLDATSATGIRGIRYSLEAGVRDVTLLDINKAAHRSTVSNLKRNRIKAHAFNKGIDEYAATCRDRYDVIDLDPFGTPVPYLNDVMRLATGDSLLMVTATDTAVLCGAQTSACIKLYGAKPLHNELCKEAGLRILAGFISRLAAQFNRGITIALSISDMHYMRLFVRMQHGAEMALSSIKENGFVSFCPACRDFSTLRGVAPVMSSKCNRCGGQVEIGGPMWLGNLYDDKIRVAMRENIAEVHLHSAVQLAQICAEPDIPFFYSLPMLSRRMKRGSVSPNRVMETLRDSGFTASKTQFDKDGLKTNASLEDVLYAMS
jgi:tRNA (guanine26-N2/guanine27-N2)-dimethyltransferase